MISTAISAIICALMGQQVAISSNTNEFKEVVNDKPAIVEEFDPFFVYIPSDPIKVEMETEIESYEPYPYIYELPSYGSLTKSAGVNFYEGRTETWYSSNILYHYRTPEWTPDENGVYRDDDGYVVVACSDISFGEVVPTSHGMGKVYDCGCAPGVTDIYVNW